MRKLLRGLMRPIGLIGLIGLMGLIGPIGLMSCSSSDDSDEEDVPVTGTPIAFSAKEGEETAVNNGGSNKAPRAYGANGAYGAVTRASSLSESVTNFKVWGYKNLNYNDGTGVYGDLQIVFPEYKVNWLSGSASSTTSNSDGWEYVNQQTSGDDEQSIKYWDWAAKAYRFFGVTGTKWESGDFEVGQFKPEANGANGPYEIEIVADATNPGSTPFFSRLWFSTGSEALYPTRLFGKPVQLEFLKPISRVRFMLTYSYQSEGIKIKSTEFKPTDGSKIARKGTCKVSYPLTGTATKETYSLISKETGTDSGELDAFTEEFIPEGKEIWYMVLPNESQDSYTMYVKMNNDTEPKTAVVPAQYMTWLPGYSYTYIFKITAEGGVEIELVESAYTPWSDDMEIDHPVFNW